MDNRPLNDRPIGVSLLAAFYFLGGLLGLWLVAFGLLALEAGILVKMGWVIGGIALTILSLALNRGLWGLRNWGHRLAIAVNALTTLSWIGLLPIVAGRDLPPVVSLLPLVGAAVNACIIWYLIRPAVRSAFESADPGSVPVDTLTEGQPVVLKAALPNPASVSASISPKKKSRQEKDTPSAKAWLVARSGPQTGQQFALNRERNTIGRDASRASIKVDDPQVSRQHAQFSFEQGHVFLYDLASTNGTFVNNRRIQKKMLSDGDVVRVGQTEFAFKEQHASYR